MLCCCECFLSFFVFLFVSFCCCAGVSDATYNKLYSYASNLNPQRLGRKHSHVAGVLAEWIQMILNFSSVLRETANDRAELRRLDQVLEHAYEDQDSDFEEVLDRYQ